MALAEEIWQSKTYLIEVGLFGIKSNGFGKYNLFMNEVGLVNGYP